MKKKLDERIALAVARALIRDGFLLSPTWKPAVFSTWILPTIRRVLRKKAKLKRKVDAGM